MSVSELVAQLIAVGTPPEVAASVVAEAFAAGAVCGQSADRVDAQAERRREKDRERQRNIRRQSADSADNRQMSAKALTLKKDIEEVKKVRASKAPLSADWKPSDAHFEAATKLNVPRPAVEAKAEDMRIWAGSTGALKVDWDLTFHGFLRRDAPKLAVQPMKVTATITPMSPSWNVWKAHYRDTKQNFSANHMDKCASDGKAFTVPSEWPPGHRDAA